MLTQDDLKHFAQLSTVEEKRKEADRRISEGLTAFNAKPSVETRIVSDVLERFTKWFLDDCMAHHAVPLPSVAELERSAHGNETYPDALRPAKEAAMGFGSMIDGSRHVLIGAAAEAVDAQTVPGEAERDTLAPFVEWNTQAEAALVAQGAPAYLLGVFRGMSVGFAKLVADSDLPFTLHVTPAHLAILTYWTQRDEETFRVTVEMNYNETIAFVYREGQAFLAAQGPAIPR